MTEDWKVIEEKKVAPKEVKEIALNKLEEKYKWAEIDWAWLPASIVFVGHVDSGKSTTCGKLLTLLGHIDE